MCELAATCVHVPDAVIAGSQLNWVTRDVHEQSAKSRAGYRNYALTRGAHLIAVMHVRDWGEENHVSGWHAAGP